VVLLSETAIDQRAIPLAPGTVAPDFTLPSTPDQMVSLAEFRGQPVILAFYPEDWSPVCSDQLALYQELLPEFQRFDAELVGISVDGVWCHLAFAKGPQPPLPAPRGLRAKRRGLARVSRLSIA
jgi:peroxiredoxin